MDAKHSKRHYRKTLHVIKTVIEETQRALTKGDGEGQEYSFLDQVTIYEQAFREIAFATNWGLKPVGVSELGKTDRPNQ